MQEDWYCKAMGMEFGPMSLEDLARLVERGNIRGGDPVRQGIDGPWIKMSDVPELVGHLTTLPPPPDADPRQAKTVRGEMPPPVAATEPVRLDGPASVEVSLDGYYGAVLFGPDGILVCDLRDCGQVTLPGVHIVDRRSAGDDTPFRLGSLELRISKREVEEANAAAEQNVASPEQPTAEAAAANSAVQPADGEKPVARRVVPQTDPNANTRDVAAETLRRMFMPRPSKTR